MKNKISEYQLERFLANELPARQMEAIQRQLTLDEDLRKRLEALQASNQAILQQYPAAKMAAAIQQRLGSDSPVHVARPRPRLTVLAWAGAAAGVALLALPLIQPKVWLTGQPGFEITRAKGGGMQLLIYRKLGDRVEQLRNGSMAKPGDLLQIAFISRKPAHGFILSIDGNGQVTQHYPTESQAQDVLALNVKTALPSAYELDNAPRFERFFFITAAAEIDSQAVMAAARTLAQQPDKARRAELPLGRDLRQISILINKGE